MQTIIDILFNNISNKKEICHFYEQYSLISSHSLSDIFDHSKNFAQNLKEIIPGSREPVLISLETSEEFLFSFFGIILSGNIPVPITSSTLILPKDYQNLIRQISDSCQAKYIIADNSFKTKNLNHIKKEQLKVINNSKLEIKHTKNTDICFIQFSSGSTQAPKGVAVTHQNLLANLEQIKNGMEVTEADSICSWLPLHHDMGLIGALLAALYTNVQCYLMPPLDFILSPRSWLNLVSEKKVSVIVAPNSAYSACTKKIKKEDFGDLNLGNIRLALSGAEPVNKDICQNFVNHFKNAYLKQNVIFPVYGLAECTLAVSFNKVGSHLSYLTVDYDALINDKTVQLVSSSESSTDIISCGQPLKEIQLDIRDESDEVLPEGNVGEIFIKGPAIVNNYYGQTSHLDNKGWLASGDLGFMYEENLYIVGRKKDLIILNGRNIAAVDIETKIYETPQNLARRTVAFSYQDKDHIEQIRVVAEVCITDPIKRENIKLQICESLRTIVPMTPDQISLIPPLLIKRTTSGKLKRYYIKQMYQIGRVNKWEKNYKLLFYRSQLLIFKIKLSFVIKEKISKYIKKRKSFPSLSVKNNKKKEKHQYGIK